MTRSLLLSLSEAPAALIVAHPGHELRVFAWMEKARPLVSVLTDGSGREGISRMDSTERTVAQAGAKKSAVFGRLSDREIYRALLRGEHTLFVELMDELAAEWARANIACVVAEAAEGHSPTHDLCRFLAGFSARKAARLSGRPIADFEYPLLARHDVAAGDAASESVCIELTEDDLQRKLAAAHDYPELATEVEIAITALGFDPFRIERLTPADLEKTWARLDERAPFYERQAEKLVAQGVYSEVIRYRKHLAPLLDALASNI